MRFNLDKLQELIETEGKPGDVYEYPGLKVTVHSKDAHRIVISVTNGETPPVLWWRPTRLDVAQLRQLYHETRHPRELRKDAGNEQN